MTSAHSFHGPRPSCVARWGGRLGAIASRVGAKGADSGFDRPFRQAARLSPSQSLAKRSRAISLEGSPTMLLVSASND